MVLPSQVQWGARTSRSKRCGHILRIAAVGVHQVQAADGEALKFPVVADVGDLLPPGPGTGSASGPLRCVNCFTEPSSTENA